MRLRRRREPEPIVYLIGGPPRCGKTIIARRLAAANDIGWLSTDWIRKLLVHGGTGYRCASTGEPPDAEAGRFLPHLTRLVDEIAYTTERYIIEGVPFLPADVAALRDSGRGVAACFVGTSRISYRSIDRHAVMNPWHRDVPPEERDALVPWILDWSDRVARECEAQGVPYVDLADGFDAAVAAVASQLGLDRQTHPVTLA